MNYITKYAVIVQALCEKTELGKKMLQKLMYLMERKGVDLCLNYSIHFFGPYSSRLDNALQILDSNDVIDIDTTGKTHVIRKGEIDIDGDIPLDEQTAISFVLSKFLGKSALELEAITTLDYAATALLDNSGTEQEIINTVKKIKGSKFTEDYLRKELSVLKETGFLS